ncbi:hypothetical protein ACWEKR_17545 [Nocardia sp. NPDC004573]
MPEPAADLPGITTEQWFDRVGMPAEARAAAWDRLALGIALRPAQRPSVPGLVLSGDWTATDWSATRESSVPSAARAVEALLELPSSA